MLGSQKLSVRWLSRGWMWPLVLLALPGCDQLFNVQAVNLPPTATPSANLNPGNPPLDGVVYCDIPQVALFPCASSDQKAQGIPLSFAALALNTGLSSTTGLDYSAAALNNCSGEPQAANFLCPFPDGCEACINIDEVIGPVYADANAVCVALCTDILTGQSPPDVPPDPSVAAYCQTAAHVSTNAPSTTGLRNACGSSDLAGRRLPESVVWTDVVPAGGLVATSGTLTRSLITSTPAAFDTGAASSQWISLGDGYVEFAATETNLSHVIGLSEIPIGCIFPCSDGDPSLQDIGFALSLNFDDGVYVLESGNVVGGPFGRYAPGTRSRVHWKDNNDGTATVTYFQVIGSCTPGNPCAETKIPVSATRTARYPFRIDASFREQGATLSDVRLVRIQ